MSPTKPQPNSKSHFIQIRTEYASALDQLAKEQSSEEERIYAYGVLEEIIKTLRPDIWKRAKVDTDGR